jgi:hypothetical protein
VKRDTTPSNMYYIIADIRNGRKVDAVKQIRAGFDVPLAACVDVYTNALKEFVTMGVTK